MRRVAKIMFYTDVAKSCVDVWHTTKHSQEVVSAFISMVKKTISARGIMSHEQEELGNIKNTFTTNSKFLGKYWKITLEECDE